MRERETLHTHTTRDRAEDEDPEDGGSTPLFKAVERNDLELPVHRRAARPDLDRCIHTAVAALLGYAPVKERHQKLNALELERCSHPAFFDARR